MDLSGEQTNVTTVRLWLRDGSVAEGTVEESDESCIVLDDGREFAWDDVERWDFTVINAA